MTMALIFYRELLLWFPTYSSNLNLIERLWKFRLFAIYGWMVFCFISTNLACFVQNLVDWAFGIILCIVQNTVELLPGV